MPETPSAHPLDASTLGPFVARVRTKRGLTQRQLAERLYVSDKTVSKWERGLSLPSVPLLVPLAEALGLSISELMSCEEAPGEKSVERAEADRLIATSLRLSGAALTGRRRALRIVAFLATIAVWAALTARAVPFRMNLGCLMRIHNGNWPAICRAGRWGAALGAVLIPVLELALGDVLSGATIGLLGCAVFFVPILVAGKLNE